MENTNTAGSWEGRYGEIVWAKFESFPWWPSFILDPHKVLKRDNCKGRAISLIGKSYTVYFYEDGTLGFVTPSNVKPFTPDNTAKFQNQKIPKAYKEHFPKAIKLAEKELALPKEERLVFYTEDENAAAGEEEEEVEDEDYSDEEEEEVEADQGVKEDKEAPLQSPTKRKREDFPSLYSTSKRLKKNTSKGKIESDDEAARNLPDEEDYSEEEDILDNHDEDGHISSEFDNSEDEGRKKKKKSGKVLGKGRLSKLSKAGDESVKKRYSKPKKPASESKAKPSFEEESREDRLLRLFEILKLTTTRATFDEARALKTLDKLKGMDLSFDELKSSGVGKFITTLKTHQSTGIKDAATNLFQIWKATMSGGNNLSRSATGEKVESGKSTTDGHSEKLPQPKVEVVVKLEDIASSEVKEDVERWRGLKLLHSVINDVELPVRFESAIFQAFPNKITYFESINRFFNLLRSLAPSEVKPFLLQQLGPATPPVNEGETETASSSHMTEQISMFIRQQFSYIAAAN